MWKIKKHILIPRETTFKKVNILTEELKYTENVNTKQRKEERNKKETSIEQTAKQQRLNTIISIIILNVNGLNIPTKRQRLPGMMKKSRLKLCVVYKRHASSSKIQMR